MVMPVIVPSMYEMSADEPLVPLRPEKILARGGIAD
jgi:hypothetical protein